MKLDIKATNIDLTAPLREYAEAKFGELDKFIQNLEMPLEAKVELGRSTFHHKKGDVFFAEVNISVPNKLIRARKDAEDIRAAIDLVKDELQRDIKKYKGISKAKHLKGMRLLKRLKNYSPFSRREK